MNMASSSPNSQTLFYTALQPLRVALLRQMLDDWSPKLGIDGAAKMLSSRVEIAETLAQWIEDNYRDQPYSVTVLEENMEKDIDPRLQKLATIATAKSIPDDSITHGIAHIDNYSRHDALWVLKKLYYAFVPKGIAIVSYIRKNPIEESINEVLASEGKTIDSSIQQGVYKTGDLAELAEEAQFERGKIRSYQKDICLKSDEVKRVIEDLEKMLVETSGPAGANRSWSELLHNATKSRAQPDGSLLFEAEFTLAMRWDLLCA